MCDTSNLDTKSVITLSKYIFIAFDLISKKDKSNAILLITVI